MQKQIRNCLKILIFIIVPLLAVFELTTFQNNDQKRMKKSSVRYTTNIIKPITKSSTNEKSSSLCSDYINISRIIYFGDRQRISYTTVLTTMYFFGKSKHSKKDYEKWSGTMTRSIGAPIVAYIDTKVEEKMIKRFRDYNLTG